MAEKRTIDAYLHTFAMVVHITLAFKYLKIKLFCDRGLVIIVVFTLFSIFDMFTM